LHKTPSQYGLVQQFDELEDSLNTERDDSLELEVFPTELEELNPSQDKMASPEESTIVPSHTTEPEILLLLRSSNAIDPLPDLCPTANK
jgi:hypothetical protein